MEAEVIELETNYWKGMEEHDYETVKNLTRFPCMVAGKNGVQSVDEIAFKKMFDGGAGAKIKVVRMSGFETQTIGDSGVVIGYIIELGMKDQPDKPAMKCACTSTWVNENGNWICAMHTESEVS